MPSNYVLLGKTTLSTSAASVTLSNIPQTGYTDLKLVCSIRVNRSNNSDDLRVTINNNTTAIYGNKRAYSTGSSVGADGGNATGLSYSYIAVAPATTASGSVYSNTEIYFPNYTSNVTKFYIADSVSENNATGGPTHLSSNYCTDTNPITTITIDGYNTPRDVLAGSTFYLYGIAAVGATPTAAPFATGGDIINNDGTYWIHTFLSSGTFTPTKTLTCDYLVVAGGAGGGSYGGGGGAGGLRSTVTATGGSGSLESALSLSAQAYNVTIGAGGAGGTSSAAQAGSAKGNAGNNSIFATITSLGGGSGLGFNQNTSALANGASGGGGIDAPSSGTYINGGTGNSNQGYAGGRGYRTGSGYNAGGGGGGAASVGGDGSGSGSSPVGGTAGSGRSVAISGSSVTYASGGTGMAESGSDAAGASGTANRGIGGNSSTGVGANRAAGGAGGSGIVIVRYPMV